MNNVWYLAIVVGLSAVGVLFLWVRNRPSASPRSSIDRFNDKMNALAPDHPTATEQSDPRRIRNGSNESS